jgi:hypothetical protein
MAIESFTILELNEHGLALGGRQKTQGKLQTGQTMTIGGAQTLNSLTILRERKSSGWELCDDVKCDAETVDVGWL